MINLTKRDGTTISVNPAYIVSIQDLPGPKGDTQIVVYPGGTYIVQETREAILALISGSE